MSRQMQYVVDTEATEEEAWELAELVCETLIRRKIIQATSQQHILFGKGAKYATGQHADEAGIYYAAVFPCGLDVILGRNVFVTGVNGLDQLGCPHCQHEHPESDLDWLAAIGDWFEQTNESMTCPRCRHASPLPDWRFEPEWGFGYLGFQFTEWDLKPHFVEEIRQLLGHRVAWVKCCL